MAVAAPVADDFVVAGAASVVGFCSKCFAAPILLLALSLIRAPSLALSLDLSVSFEADGSVAETFLCPSRAMANWLLELSADLLVALK